MKRRVKLAAILVGGVLLCSACGSAVGNGSDTEAATEITSAMSVADANAESGAAELASNAEISADKDKTQAVAGASREEAEAEAETTTEASSASTSEVAEATESASEASDEVTEEVSDEALDEMPLDQEIVEVNVRPLNYQRYGKRIRLRLGANSLAQAVADRVEEGYSVGSFVYDLDQDGRNEAVVISGGESEPDSWNADDNYRYWYVKNAWYVDDDNTISEFPDFVGTFVATEQYALRTENATFIAINGYNGMDGIGTVYRVENGTLVNAAPGTWKNGRKFFINAEEILWDVESYSAFFMIMEGYTPKEMGGSGRCYLPYKLHLNGSEYELYGAREISFDEVQSMAPLNTDNIANLGKAQFILRDNGELDVNFLLKDEYDYNFYTNIYHLPLNNSGWILDGVIEGYMDVNLGMDNDWAVLSEKMEK